ncbi:TylF/MycF/NovP-related O-methyltransferase [Mesorhizobium sp. M0306]|uniref:TylF/MycF/NovP-related O-methyltransferase n=1 Tax=unclassified Mesorhizobium TaxID=325217 RepID=UPI003335F179
MDMNRRASLWRARWERLRVLTRKVGRQSDITFQELVKRNCHLLPGAEYSLIFEEARQATSLEDDNRNQTRKFLRQAGLYHCLRSVLGSGLEGDFAECGSFRGQAAYLIARLMELHNRRGELHIFDSFAGLSQFVKADNVGLQRDKQQTDRMRAHFAFPEEVLCRNLARFDIIRVHAGWIPERFPEVADRRFALTHIDVDLYEPTLQSLRFFYPRTVPGGWLIVDDYNSVSFPGAKAAVDEFLKDETPCCALPQQVGAFLIRK